MAFVLAIAALCLGGSSAFAAAPSGTLDEKAFWSRVKIDPALPEPLRARTQAAVQRLLKAPSLQERARVIAEDDYDVLVSTCAGRELSDHALPYTARAGGVAGYAEGEVTAAFHAGRLPTYRICWDESYARAVPGRRGGLPEIVIAHELFGHAATNVLRLKEFIPAGAMTLPSENELNAYMLQGVAMRELGYPYDHPFTGKKPVSLAAYEEEILFSKPQYVRLLTPRETADPLKAYVKRRIRWVKDCGQGRAGACTAAKKLEETIAALRTEPGRKAYAQYIKAPVAVAFHARLRKESEALRLKLATLGQGYETPGMFSYDPRQDEIQYGAPIPPD